jgi:hypothetical protein
MGGGSGMLTLIATCAIVGTEMMVTNAMIIVPKSSLFNSDSSFILFSHVYLQNVAPGDTGCSARSMPPLVC